MEKNLTYEMAIKRLEQIVAKIENGKLVPVSIGTTTLVATDKNSGLSAACLVIVGEKDLEKIFAILKKNFYHLNLSIPEELHYELVLIHLTVNQ